MVASPYKKKKNVVREEMDREEIIDILKRNVALYKNDPDFANYFLDLALYLLEYHYLEHIISDKRKKAKSSKKISSKVYRISKKFDENTEKYCRVCGAPTGGMMKCPNCRNIT